MKRILLLVFALSSATVVAQVPVGYTYESITFGATSVGFNQSTIAPSGKPQANVCSGVLESTGGEIRFKYDGGVPTSSEGQPLEPTQIITLSGPLNLQQFRGIRTTSTSGVIKFTCSAAM